MRMIDLGGARGAMQIVDRPTSVDCEKDVRCWRSLRSLVEIMVPCCGYQSVTSSSSDNGSDNCRLGSTVTGTIFGYRRGRVNFCVQDDSRALPLLLLEFAVPTHFLAREMQYGVLRIALECDKQSGQAGSLGSLFSVPVWTMYCNGRRMGFAVKRRPSDNDRAILKLMRSVSVGAGVLPAGDHGEVMYMRANYERVVGSADSESFHMINPVGSTAQELSIFLLRS